MNEPKTPMTRRTAITLPLLGAATAASPRTARGQPGPARPPARSAERTLRFVPHTPGLNV